MSVSNFHALCSKKTVLSTPTDAKPFIQTAKPCIHHCHRNETIINTITWRLRKTLPELPVSASRPLRSCKIMPFPTKDSPETHFRDWSLPSTPRPLRNLSRTLPSLSYSSNAMVFLLLWKNTTQNYHSSCIRLWFLFHSSLQLPMSFPLIFTRTVPNRSTDLLICVKNRLCCPQASHCYALAQSCSDLIKKCASRLPCPRTCQTKPSPVCLSQSSGIVFQIISSILNSATFYLQIQPSAQLYPILYERIVQWI